MQFLRHYDSFDKANLVLIAGILIVIIVMIAYEKREVGSAIVDPVSMSHAQNKASLEEDQKLYKRVFDLEEKGDFKDALKEIDTMIKNHPERGQSWVYQARLYKKQAILSQCSHAYRQAIETNSQFLNKHYYLFINAEVLELLSSAIPKFKREQKLKPADREVKKTLKDLYYLRRKVAGGCE